jgi:hypothetical protein
MKRYDKMLIAMRDQKREREIKNQDETMMSSYFLRGLLPPPDLLDLLLSGPPLPGPLDRCLF